MTCLERLRENREKFEEEVLFRVTEEDEQIVLESENAEDDKATAEASS